MTSRNAREGRYAGWCYGMHRRTRESLYDAPRWYWASRQCKRQLRKRNSVER